MPMVDPKDPGANTDSDSGGESSGSGGSSSSGDATGRTDRGEAGNRSINKPPEGWVSGEAPDQSRVSDTQAPVDRGTTQVSETGKTQRVDPLQGSGETNEPFTADQWQAVFNEAPKVNEFLPNPQQTSPATPSVQQQLDNFSNQNAPSINTSEPLANPVSSTTYQDLLQGSLETANSSADTIRMLKMDDNFLQGLEKAVAKSVKEIFPQNEFINQPEILADFTSTLAEILTSEDGKLITRDKKGKIKKSAKDPTKLMTTPMLMVNENYFIILAFLVRKWFRLDEFKPRNWEDRWRRQIERELEEWYYYYDPRLPALRRSAEVQRYLNEFTVATKKEDNKIEVKPIRVPNSPRTVYVRTIPVTIVPALAPTPPVVTPQPAPRKRQAPAVTPPPVKRQRVAAAPPPPPSIQARVLKKRKIVRDPEHEAMLKELKEKGDILNDLIDVLEKLEGSLPKEQYNTYIDEFKTKYPQYQDHNGIGLKVERQRLGLEVETLKAKTKMVKRSSLVADSGTADKPPVKPLVFNRAGEKAASVMGASESEYHYEPFIVPNAIVPDDKKERVSVGVTSMSQRKPIMVLGVSVSQIKGSYSPSGLFSDAKDQYIIDSGGDPEIALKLYIVGKSMGQQPTFKDDNMESKFRNSNSRFKVGHENKSLWEVYCLAKESDKSRAKDLIQKVEVRRQGRPTTQPRIE